MERKIMSDCFNHALDAYESMLEADEEGEYSPIFNPPTRKAHKLGIQTNQDVFDLLDKGGIVSIKLTGVSFDNRQDVIKNMMRQESPKEIFLIPETDNKWDKFAIGVCNYEKKPLGFIPKNKDFSITLPNRKRPVPFGKYIIDGITNKPLQTNQIFHQDMLEEDYTGTIDRFLSFGDNDKVAIGIQIKFWLV